MPESPKNKDMEIPEFAEMTCASGFVKSGFFLPVMVEVSRFQVALLAGII